MLAYPNSLRLRFWSSPAATSTHGTSMARRGLAAALMLAAGVSCKTVHCGNAVLLERVSTDETTRTETFKLVTKHPAKEASSSQYLSGNPISIAKECEFRLDIGELVPGWIHEGSAPRLPAPGDSTWSSRQDEWSKEDRQHLRGKELWLITVVRGLDVQDPLQLKTKTYIRSTNIKYDSESFALIPFDGDESLVFNHGADSSYRVSFRLYEVDGLELKRIVAGAVRDNSGVWDALGNVVTGLKGALASLIGSPGQKWIEKFKNEPVFFERLLLESGGTLEFDGSVTVLVSDPPLVPSSDGVSVSGAPAGNPGAQETSAANARARDFILLDPIKSSWFDFKPGESMFHDQDSYAKAQEQLRKRELKVGPGADAALRNTYLRLHVTETPQASDAKSEKAREALAEVQAIKSLPKDERSKIKWDKFPGLRDYFDRNMLKEIEETGNLDRVQRVLMLQSRTVPKD